MYLELVLQAARSVSAEDVRKIVNETLDSTHGMTSGQEQLITAGVISYLCAGAVQWAKWSKLKAMNWITENTPWMTRLVVALLSAGTAIGIHVLWNWNAQPGVFSFSLTGLTVPNLLDGLKHVIFNYAQQHGWWKILYAGREPARAPKVVAA